MKKEYTVQMPKWAAILMGVMGVFMVGYMGYTMITTQMFFPLIVAFIAIILVVSFYVYMVLKVRVEVRGNVLTIYPLIKKTYAKTFDEIEKIEVRRVKATKQVIITFNDGKKATVNSQMKNFDKIVEDLSKYMD